MRQSYGPLMLACPHHPELGSFAYLRRSAVHVLDLASCRDRVVRRGVHGSFGFASGGRIRVRKLTGTVDTTDGRFAASVRATGNGKTAKQTIWVTDRRTDRSHPAFSETEYYKRIGPGGRRTRRPACGRSGQATPRASSRPAGTSGASGSTGRAGSSRRLRHTTPTSRRGSRATAERSRSSARATGGDRCTHCAKGRL